MMTTSPRQAQTPDQLRSLALLDIDHPPSLQTLAPPGCAAAGAGLCRLQDFTSVLQNRLGL
jgi:hypothetical protein